MLSHNHINSTDQYVALDVEITGLSPKNGDRVIEIGAVAIEDQSIVKDRNLKTLPVIIVFAFKAKKKYNLFKLRREMEIPLFHIFKLRTFCTNVRP